MRYTGEYTAIDGTNYRVTLETSKGSGEQTLLMSGSPFTSSVKGDGKHLYSPIRCGGATVRILTREPIFDLYTGQAKGVSVKLENTDNGKTEWTGFVTPTMYSQGFDEDLEEIEIDCVDGLAVLKELPYWRGGEETIRPLAEVVFYCLKQSGCYRHLYVSDNVQHLSATGRENVLEKFRISDVNFRDLADSPDQTPDELSWKCYDVLQEICRWLGLTIVADGDAVFMIDYDAMKKGQNRYYHYDISGDSRGTAVHETVEFSYDITGASYSENGTDISLSEVYNKITVVDDFNTFDNLFPTFGDVAFENNITATQEIDSWMRATLANYPVPANPDPEPPVDGSEFGGIAYCELFKEDRASGVDSPFYLVVYVDAYRKPHVVVFRFYDSPVFKFIKWDPARYRDVTDDFQTVRCSDMFNYNGAFYLRYCDYNVSEEESESGSLDIYNFLTGKYLPKKDTMTQKERLDMWANYLAQRITPGKVDLKPYILFMNYGENRFGPSAGGGDYNLMVENEETKFYPYMTLKPEYARASIFGSSPDAYIRIKGKFRFHNAGRSPFIFDGDNSKLRRAPDIKSKGEMFLWCRLKWGDVYWNGDEWTTTKTCFKLYYLPSEKEQTLKDIYNKDFSFINANRSGGLRTMGEDGCLIPAPTDVNLQGEAEITFFTRDMHGDSRKSHWGAPGTKFDNRYNRYFSTCIILTDLAITAEVLKAVEAGEDDTDTVYTNVIENGSVSALNEIKFKVTTDDGKKPNYSSVDYLDAEGNSRNVTTTYNKALATSEKGTIGTDGEDGKLRQEEHYVFKLASQYAEPRVTLKCNLHNDGHKPYGVYTDTTLSGRTFIMTGYEIDWRMNQAELTLEEKL